MAKKGIPYLEGNHFHMGFPFPYVNAQDVTMVIPELGICSVNGECSIKRYHPSWSGP